MAFVYREEKLKNVRPATALGPGEYLPITRTKYIKSNEGIAPFETSTEKFKPINGKIDTLFNPGPGKYYKDIDEIKTEKIKNEATIKYLNQDENIAQEKINNKNGNNKNTQYNLRTNAEKLGFDIKDKRFKEKINENPGPGNYFKNMNNMINTINDDNNKRCKSANYNNRMVNNLVTINNNINNNNDLVIHNKVLVPSIPYNDNGFEIINDELVKIEDPNSYKKFKGDKKESVGPGSYQLDDPQHWHRTGTAWSKQRASRMQSANTLDSSKITTRPQTSNKIGNNNNNINDNNNNKDNVKFDIRIVSANPNKRKKLKNFNTNRVLSSNRLKRQENVKKYMEEEDDKQNFLNNKNYQKEFDDFYNQQQPGPGYYIDIQKNSDFYEKSIPYPENKQFFLSNMERFPPNTKSNVNVGPTTYFTNNQYYNSAFNNGNVQKIKEKNKEIKAPFSTRQKRFKIDHNQRINLLNPGPGQYDPKLYKNIEKNHFNDKVTNFNFRSKRFGPTTSNLKWMMNTPGPGSYINPYSATGTNNTVLVNGLYLDTRKGKELIRARTAKNNRNNNNINGIFIGSSLSKNINNNNNNERILENMRNINKNPGVGTYDADKIFSIDYNNKKKAHKSKEIGKLNIAFDSHNTRANDPNYIKMNKDNGTRFKQYKNRSNIGPGFYYKEKVQEVTQINPPFHDSTIKYKPPNDLDIGPGQYDTNSYFDWNKKTFNIYYI